MILIKNMIVCGTKDIFENVTLLCPKQLVHAAAEETRNHAHKILRSQATANIDKILKKKLGKSSQNNRNQNTRDFIKNFTSLRQISSLWKSLSCLQ